MELDELVARTVDSIRTGDDPRAIAVVGSYARKPGGDHNDVDVLVVPDEPYSRLRTEMVEGVLFEISYHSEEWCRWLLDGEYWWFNYWWITNADVRYDPGGLFEELRDVAERQRREKLSEFDGAPLRHELWDRKRDVEAASGPQKRYLLEKFFDYLLRKYYYVAGEVPVKPNYRIDRLAEFDEDAHRAAVAFLEADSIEGKERHLGTLLEAVVAAVGEPDPIHESPPERFEDHYHDLPGWVVQLGTFGE